MGMFLSQYSMLKAIGYGEAGQMKEETEKILEPYKLFVLVLHDPEKHTSFHHKFSQLFERLDYLTGHNLLFMGIAKPSYDWYKRHENKDYFGIWEKEQLVRSFHEIKGADSSITCYSIAKALNIDYDDLPCLIISPDFRSNKFVVLKTGETHIESQLLELGVFASSVSEKRAFIYSESFKSLLHNIDYYKQSEFVDQNESLGASLADIFSFSVPENSHFGRDANSHSNRVLNKLLTRIKITTDTDQIENTKMNLLTSLANKFNNSYKILNDHDKFNSLNEPLISYHKSEKSSQNIIKPPGPVASIRVDYVASAFSNLKTHIELFESETKIIVSTTEAVYKMFECISLNERVDFSPLILGLSKIFEIETNLSIVQWVRKYLNIEMPDYFKKYKPGFNNATMTPDETIVTNPLPIDFNKHNRQKWIAPGIGQSELVIRSLFKSKLFIESFSENDEVGLLDVWKPIREMRNRATHVDIMNVEDLQKLASNMNTLISSNNLNKMLQLKKNYRGEVRI